MYDILFSGKWSEVHRWHERNSERLYIQINLQKKRERKEKTLKNKQELRVQVQSMKRKQ